MGPSDRANPNTSREPNSDWSAGVRFGAAGSTGRRNTGVKSLCWGFKLQGLTWSFVYGMDLFLGEPGHGAVSDMAASPLIFQIAIAFLPLRRLPTSTSG